MFNHYHRILHSREQAQVAKEKERATLEAKQEQEAAELASAEDEEGTLNEKAGSRRSSLKVFKRPGMNADNEAQYRELRIESKVSLNKEGSWEKSTESPAWPRKRVLWPHVFQSAHLN